MFNKKNKDTTSIDIDTNNIPKHIGIIMDGNGRWAKRRNLPRSYGHKAGVETIRRIIKECNRLGVKYLTLYAFSTENWKRPEDEVNALMGLLVEYLKKEFKELDKNQVVINYIGDISKLPLRCQEELIKAKENTKSNTGVVMNLALNYGGRAEIIEGINRFLKDHNGEDNLKITEEILENYLYTKGMPDPDIVIRPSGEQRLSNFLLWQCAYTEFWYSDILWPDFTEKDLQQAIIDYQNRERRFGGL
ncbi:isoprenyl transferase [Alloiococcus sp. CFN-8]|uniref:isoprenyl transferase n=1 Tax=Alloiococcus sp. CFN-8 TaxID=3416081 RepID=UPI003CEFC63D